MHRKCKSGCEHVIKHFQDSCPGYPFRMQIIAIFKAWGYENNELLKSLDKDS